MTNPFLVSLLVIVGIIFTVLILRYAFSSQLNSREAFIAIDGTKFYNEKSFNEYDSLYKKLECLYQEELLDNVKNKKDILGLKLIFINNIRKDGFKDIKTLIDYKDDFAILAQILSNNETDPQI